MDNFLIVGLGNPGKEYEKTRHNVGFEVLDSFAEKEGASFSEKKAFGFSAQCKKKGRTIFLLKPTTFMNNSGEVVSFFKEYYKINPENILVIHDDLDIDFGKVKISKDSRAAGHNGVQSIIDQLGTKDFSRMRIGIANELSKSKKIEGRKFVLQRFNKEEQAEIEKNRESFLKKIDDFTSQN